jgi:hypothetical protein
VNVVFAALPGIFLGASNILHRNAEHARNFLNRHVVVLDET